jgi:UDPglucose 6-dehydrogenase
LYISTDWEEFRGLSTTIENAVQPPYLVIDGRRMIPDYDQLVDKGYEYLSVGDMLRRSQVADEEEYGNGRVPAQVGVEPENAPIR